MMVFLICAGLLGLLAVALTVNVGAMRGRKKIFLGDGGDPEMLAAIRAHANLVEFVPLALLLIWLLRGPYGNLTIAVLAILLTVGRLLHAGGMLGHLKGGRAIGAVLTTVVLAIASALLILSGFSIRLY
ncbi:hypothetical protein SAMN02745126_06458 [Enhydrobacter aerosaccus]|uniref:Glutathione S-transferase n=1 Tax=Enhydrobacter aerosaccus TaxID=225324 RepID=A0A1T4TL76_9HYPH|nr:MAPEG family protein [Enhydrobacter aerosaccus]SKA41041.1 hypothetical protein SAMN02745126_06458 [Enhydrobacter aerosaccus]